MKLIFLGEPGSGKGTVAKIISEKLNIPHISSGELFRKEIEEGTELGLKVKAMPLYALVPDEITNVIVKKRLTQADCKNGFILDGFPRTIEQAKTLEGISDIDIVIKFNADEDFIIKRLVSRRSCPKCKRGYNLITTLKPKNDEMCDDCNIELTKRKDDDEDIVRKRLIEYKEKTAPLVDYYKEKGILKEVENIKSPKEVVEETLNEIRNIS